MDLVTTPDGGVCVVGENAALKQNWLLKTDASGEKQWAKILPVTDWGFPVLIANAAGGFTILANRDGRSDFIITDQSGTVMKYIDLEIQSNRFTQLTDGRYVVVSNPGGGKIWLLDAEGGKIWERELQDARGVVATKDGHFVIMGYENETYFLTKWDTHGNELWRQSYPQLEARPFQYLFNKIVENAEGGISFIGFTDGTSAFIAKTDADGHLICARNQQLENHPVVLMSMAATSDKGFAIVGTKGSGFSEDLFLMKTDSLCQTDDLEIIHNVDGNVETIYAEKFSFRYGPNPCSNLVTFEIQPTEPLDGSMALVFADLLGRVVKMVRVENAILPVSMDGLAEGMYVFWFEKNGKIQGKGKVIVLR